VAFPSRTASQPLRSHLPLPRSHCITRPEKQEHSNVDRNHLYTVKIGDKIRGARPPRQPAPVRVFSMGAGRDSPTPIKRHGASQLKTLTGTSPSRSKKSFGEKASKEKGGVGHTHGWKRERYEDSWLLPVGCAQLPTRYTQYQVFLRSKEWGV